MASCCIIGPYTTGAFSFFPRTLVFSCPLLDSQNHTFILSLTLYFPWPSYDSDTQRSHLPVPEATELTLKKTALVFSFLSNL